MRLVKVSAPEGMGEKVAQLAFESGIDQVSLHRQDTLKPNGTRTGKDVIDIQTSTPAAKKFIEALMAAPFYDPGQYSLNVRQPRSIASRGGPSKVTWNAAADLSRRYSTSLVGRVLKLDSSRLKKLLIKRSARTSIRRKPQAAFFQLPTDIALPEVESTLSQSPIGCRLQIERPDGSRLTLTLPALDLVSISRLCADFLRS